MLSLPAGNQAPACRCRCRRSLAAMTAAADHLDLRIRPEPHFSIPGSLPTPLVLSSSFSRTRACRNPRLPLPPSHRRSASSQAPPRCLRAPPHRAASPRPRNRAGVLPIDHIDIIFFRPCPPPRIPRRRRRYGDQEMVALPPIDAPRAPRSIAHTRAPQFVPNLPDHPQHRAPRH